MIPEISARISDVHDELKKLLSHLDEFPDTHRMTDVDGANVSVAMPFYSDLQNVASVAAQATERMMTELVEMDSTVRAALDDLSEQDAELAASAQRFESFLDDAAERVTTVDASENEETTSKNSFGRYAGGAGS